MTEILELLGAQVEDSALIGGFGGRKVKRVADTEIQIQTRRDLPVVLQKPFLKPSARLQDMLLQVDGKLLNLTEEEAGER